MFYEKRQFLNGISAPNKGSDEHNRIVQRKNCDGI